MKLSACSSMVHRGGKRRADMAGWCARTHQGSRLGRHRALYGLWSKRAVLVTSHRSLLPSWSPAGCWPSVSLIMERNADVCRADQLLLFVIFFVFLELRLFVAKQSLEHPAPLKIGRVFDHCPIVLNVLSSDKTFHNNLRRSAARPRQP
jgi:hypothetical protein